MDFLKEAQEAVGNISKDYNKENVYSSSFFISLLSEQVGQVAEKYVHKGREAAGIEVDVADVIVCCLAFMNWLSKDASTSFEKALRKHKARLASLQAT